MRKSKGYLVNTRALLRKNARERGKIGLSKILHSYDIGDKVVVKIDSSVHKGKPHRRYHGKVGVIADKRGRSYVLHVTQRDAKEIIAEHLTHYAGEMRD
jgi:large subunit ribosomal protein L21e